MLAVSPDLTAPNHNNNNNHTSLEPPDGGAMVASPAEAQESGGTSGGGCGDADGATHAGLFLSEEGEKTGGGGNRWPKQETLALLKIRSDMDLAFRDSTLKGPLWEDVSRKMAELGYHRNAKKCKEKFENVYKYHKRTKEGRSSKADGKTYRFFDQLQALENIIGGAPPQQQPPPPPSFFESPPPPRAVTMAVPIQVVQAPPPSPPQIHQHTVSSTPQNNTLSFNNPFTSSPPQQPPPPSSFFSNSPLLYSSSSTSSDEEDVERRHKRKRKYKDLFERLMRTVVEKQEDFQRKFLETLEKREKGRMLREEAWRAQEIARLKNEHHLLVQERSNAAARESTLISLLQKATQNHQNPICPNSSIIVHLQETTPTPPPSSVIIMKQSPPPPPPHVLEPPLTAPRVSAPQPIRAVENFPTQDNNNNGGLEAFNTTTSTSSASSSRWPKAEIDALINLRTHLDNKYQENGPKGPLWEEISCEMKKIGYNRNAKRCKEKWENINKYFKKVKESNKKRPQDSKTCPYFHQLEALYKEKEKYGKPENSSSSTMPIIMATPEQQWPLLLAQEHHNQQHDGELPSVVQVQTHLQQAMEEREGENNNDDDDDDDEEYDEDDDDDDEDEGSAFEIVTNKQPSSVTTTA